MSNSITLTVKVQSRKAAREASRALEALGLVVERRDPERFPCYWCGKDHGLVCPAEDDEVLP